MIRNALLALLGDDEKYGYQLKSDFEAATGSAWALNIGQVYSTLQRLERDGVVLALGEDDDGRSRYKLSAVGREELREWLSTAVERTVATRDEVVMKVLVANATGTQTALKAIAVQRAAAMRVLQEATLTRNATDDLADQLHLDRLIVLSNAEVRWLDLAEDQLAAAKVQERTTESVQVSKLDKTGRG